MTDANLDIEFDSLLTHFTDITFDGVTAKLITIYSLTLYKTVPTTKVLYMIFNTIKTIKTNHIHNYNQFSIITSFH